MGGETTAVACRLIGRRFIGLDLDPVALAKTSERLEQGDVLTNLPLFQSPYPAASPPPVA